MTHARIREYMHSSRKQPYESRLCAPPMSVCYIMEYIIHAQHIDISVYLTPHWKSHQWTCPE